MTNDQTVSFLRFWRLYAAQISLILCLAIPAPLAAQTHTFSGTVNRAIDGDTFRMSGLDPAIRVWGLDAPERDEAGGAAATRAIRGLISGQTLTCRIRDVDRYARIVGQCFLPDGRDITAEMIRLRVATEYCYFSKNHYGTC